MGRERVEQRVLCSTPDPTPDPPTTRSRLVCQTLVTAAVQDENNDGERRMATSNGPDQGPEQPRTEFQILLRPNNELMIRVDHMSRKSYY